MSDGGESDDDDRDGLTSAYLAYLVRPCLEVNPHDKA